MRVSVHHELSEAFYFIGKKSASAREWRMKAFSPLDFP